MKVIFALLCIVLVSAKYYEDEQTIDVLDFLNGLFNALNEKKNDFVNIAACVKNSKELIAEYVKVWEIIKRFDSGMIMVLAHAVASAYKMTVIYIKGCNGTNEELQKVLNVIMNFNIFSFIMHIIRNGKEICAYIAELVYAENALAIGKAAGHLVYKAFFDGKLLSDLNLHFSFDDFVRLLENFLNEATNKTFKGNISDCLKSFPEVYIRFCEVIEMIKKISFKDLHLLIQVLVKLFDVMKTILKAIEPCTAFPQVLYKMYEMIISKGFMEIFKKITSDLGKFLMLLTNLISAITDESYSDLGKSIGKIFLFLFSA